MILNKTKGTKLAIKAQYCTSLWAKTKGLMFSRMKTLIFVFDKEQKIPLHMFFVFFPIDVLWLGKDKRVVQLKQLKPFTLFKPNKLAMYVIELPANTIKESNTKVGDTITFK